MLRKIWFCLAVAALSACAGLTTALCQMNTGTITGIVVDPSGAAIPQAHIESTDDLTGLSHVTTSNSAGQYTFSFLPIGRYTITVAASGFRREVQKGVAISAGQILTLDLHLHIGGVRQTVTVSGSPVPLDYTGPEQRNTLGNEQIQQLPMAEQDWSSLLPLINGMKSGGSGGFSMNGLPPAAMNLTIDGTNAEADPEVSTIGFYDGFNVINNINTAAISEITVSKGIAPASTGTGMSGNINIISKSGTNQFHGSAFEYNDNSAFDARNQFLSTKPRSNFNEFGGSLGGPILKDRLFFFGDYEGVRQSSFSPVSGDVPTPQFVQQTLAIAPEYAPIFKVFPSPNQPYAPGSVTGYYEAAASEIENDSNADARVDYYFNPTNQLTLRVTRSRPYDFEPSIISVNPETYAGQNDVYNAQFTHTSGNWTAATRVAYNRMKEQRLNHAFGLGLDEIEYSGFDSQGGENYNILGGTYTWQEDLAVSYGRNMFQFGGIVQLFRDGRIDDTTTTFKYSDLSDFLTDIPSKIEINFPLTQFQLQKFQFGGYVQDAYRMRPNLTLNVGMRYDYFTVPKEASGRVFTRNPTSLGPGTGSLRPANQMYQSDWPNFSPRVGFAWSPGSQRKTVVRGGFGVFFNTHSIIGGPIDDVLDSPYVPFRLTLDRSQALSMGLNYPVDKAAVESQLIANQTPVATTAIDDYFPNPYSLQYTLDVQRDLGRGFILDTGYIATRGLNLDLLDEQTNLPNRLTGVTPDPAFGQFKYYQAADISSYNGWQTSLERRFRNGLLVGANYTWSRSFAYDSDADLDELDGAIQNYNNIRADHGPTNYDIPNHFTLDFVYMLPFDRWAGLTGRGARMLIGGWQLSSVFTAESGGPDNVENGNSSYPDDRPDLVNGVDPYFSNYRSTLQYVDPSAFAQVPLVSASGAQERPGNLSRMFLRDPGSWVVDLGVAKNFLLREGMNLQFRGDFFNGFNHTNLGGLDTDTSDSTFGRLTSATARTIQLGAKLTF
ncbi:MAG TPA: carboxypeptidase regulatory-like domain-containing protein [Terriglobia bacterium]|nr:carboxypeptidase regulatory-like domain-containing protein [Terriglobia bacterium]